MLGGWSVWRCGNLVVVGCYHVGLDCIVRSREWVARGGEELWDFNAVADCWAIATTADGEGMVR